MLRRDVITRAAAAVAIPRDVSPLDWAVASVDYSRAPAYEVECKGPYDPDYMPYWREPMAAVMDRTVREVWVLKCARSGGSENLLLTTMRWALSTRPQPMLYVSGQQQSVERFMEKRIKPGFMLARDTARKYRAARVREHEIFFEDCDLIATWPRNTMAFKQAGYSLIFGDEVSTWPEYSADMLRKRTDNWTFSHILCVSSPDPQSDRPSDEDPIFQEHATTDRREWYCKDPATGTPFVFRLGGPATIDGIKWDEDARSEDGTWDIERVRATAHYITPDGTRIDSCDRQAVVRSGGWVATAAGANPSKRGYRVTGFMTPFASGDFGEMAARFLTAKHKGVGPGFTNQQALRGFMYEDLAEPFYMEKNAATDSEVAARAGGYARGVLHTTVDPYKTAFAAAQHETIAAIDVQKDHLWMNVREWVYPGESALVEWRKVLTWEDALEVCERYDVKMAGIDYGFAYREGEVFRVAYETKGGPYGTQWVVPLKGVDRMAVELEQAHRDPFIGTRTGGSERIDVVRFRADTFRTVLMHLIRGEHARRWLVYDGVELDYARQVTAMERVDGRWKLRKGHSADHLFDCEVMQLVVAKLRGLWDDRPAIGKAAGNEKQQAVDAEKRS